MGRKKKTSRQPESSNSLLLDGRSPAEQGFSVEGVEQSGQSMSYVNMKSNVPFKLGENDTGANSDDLAESIKGKSTVDDAGKVFDEKPARGRKGKGIVDDAGKVFDAKPARGRKGKGTVGAAEKVFDKKPAFRWLNLDDVSSSWGYFLFGYFDGRFPRVSALLKLCNSWNVKYHYHPHSSGMLVFGFENERNRDTVLKGGPYYLKENLLKLGILPRSDESDDVEVNILPVWVRLPCLPLECWHVRALGKITSRVGKPICMDEYTKNREKISYARALVEVDFAKELVRSVPLRLPCGIEFEQEVVYEFETKFCALCRMFGHLSDACGMENRKSASEEVPVSHQPDPGCSTVVPQVDAQKNRDETSSQQVSQQVQHLVDKVTTLTVQSTKKQSDHCSNSASETMVDEQNDETKVKNFKGRLVIQSKRET